MQKAFREEVVMQLIVKVFKNQGGRMLLVRFGSVKRIFFLGLLLMGIILCHQGSLELQRSLETQKTKVDTKPLEHISVVDGNGTDSNENANVKTSDFLDIFMKEIVNTGADIKNKPIESMKENANTDSQYQ
mmetsp:Transcript_17028/g.24090  ORF Transcript_17028/g.24090 Transcript_17028/m.24090 type:complete len:131 (+) Transcript_17028:340-732(+)